MREYFLAEKMKNRHTYLQKLMVLMPAAVVCLSVWLATDYFMIDSYNWWYMVLFPSMVALVGASVGNRDKKMGNRTIRVLPVKMGAVWDAKVLYGIQCMGIALLVFLGMTLAVGTWLEHIQQVFPINPSVGTASGGSSLICDVSVADSLLSAFAAAYGRIPYAAASYGQLYIAFSGVSASPIFYGPAWRNYGKADVYHLKNTSQWAGGRARERDIYTGVIGMERAACRNCRFCSMVRAALEGRP